MKGSLRQALWVLASLALGGLSLAPLGAGEEVRRTAANQVVEISFTSPTAYPDPFNDVEMDVLVTEPGGKPLRVPAFWAGGQTWRARYASATLGLHRFQSECSDRANSGLHGARGTIEVAAYRGDNPLYRHGPIRLAADRRHFEHADGTPLLWLGDTWWMGLCRRLHWPDEFKALAADRRAKGFNVVQIVAGLYPDMGAFDDRGRNEAGFPWLPGYARINPAYFDAADARVAWLVESGLSPCIVGAWGYHLPWLGVERMKRHWRYLVARYGAWPVVWCVAGEGTMPYYLSTKRREEEAMQKRGWTEVAAYLRRIDPYHRLVTIHPPASARETVDDPAVLDFDMLQTGHSDRASIPNTLQLVRRSRQARPVMPTVVGEVCYEGILDRCFDEIQRFMVWTSYLGGTAGHTYGANGIWQVNRRGEPYGPSPHGGNWGNRPWDDAMKLPGSRQVGLAKRLLEQYPWQKFEPHPEWASYPAPPEGKSAAAPPWGDWIWYPEGKPAQDAPAETRYFRRTFEIPEGKRITRAVLRISADDHLTAYLNGTRLGAHADWRSGREFRGLQGRLKPGKNVLAVAGTNGKAPVPRNPAGLIAGLLIELADGPAIRVLSDTAWRTSQTEAPGWQTIGFDDRHWVQAMSVARYGEMPWGNIVTQQEPFMVPYAAGIARAVRIVYLPLASAVAVHKLEPGVCYQAGWFSPLTGERTGLGPAQGDARGSWTSPEPPASDHDWVLILDASEEKPSAGQGPAWEAVWNTPKVEAGIRGTIHAVDAARMSKHLFYLAKDPLPYRKLNFTLPGHEKNTLYEADDYLAGKLESWGYRVQREGVRVQAFRRDTGKPKHAQYSRPMPEDAWYTAYNLYAEKKGRSRPDDIILVLAHKDSQSWIDSPGANDNAIGTVGVLEMACVLAGHSSERTIRFLFCNEEHTPWTSVTAAQNAKRRGDKIVAVFNIDGIGAKTAEQTAAGKKTNVTAYTEPEGKRLAELMSAVNGRFAVGLEQRVVKRPGPGDDDGSFVRAGYPAAIINIGSWPYGDPNYHAEGDIPERCDVPNAAKAVQATLAAILTLDQAP